MNAIPMSLLLETLRVLDDCAKCPRHDDTFSARLKTSDRANSAAFRLRMALGELPAVVVTDVQEA